MTIEKLTIKKGESLALTYALNPAADLTNWACRVQIRDNAFALAHNQVITSTIETNTKFSGIISYTITDALAEGTYYIAAELKNSTTGECIEDVKELTITRQYVYD